MTLADAQSILRRDELPTYDRFGRHDYLHDLIEGRIDGNGPAAQRLRQHAYEVATRPEFAEVRAIDSESGSSSYAIPPRWLIDDLIPVARPGRVTADLAVGAELDRGTNSLNIPKWVVAAVASSQHPENSAPEDNSSSFEDTFVNATVITIATELWTSQQVFEQTPGGLSRLAFPDLISAKDTELDAQFIAGSGAGSGQLPGIVGADGVNQITCTGHGYLDFYDAAVTARSAILTSRYLDGQVWVMKPQRFMWLQASADAAGRPLFLPRSPGMGGNPVLAGVARSAVVGEFAGLPVVLDASSALDIDGGGDYVLLLRGSDINLWESPVHVRALQQTQAGELQVGLQAISYVAAALRFASGQSVITMPPVPQYGS